MKRINLLAGVVAALMIACSQSGAVHGIMKGAEVALCVADHQDEPLEVVIAKCGEKVSPQDIERILQEQRAATARSVAAKRAAACGSPDAGAK